MAAKNVTLFDYFNKNCKRRDYDDIPDDSDDESCEEVEKQSSTDTAK